MCAWKGISPVFIASDYMTVFARLSCIARAFFIRLHGGVVSSIDAVCSSWHRYNVKPSQQPLEGFPYQGAYITQSKYIYKTVYLLYIALCL